MRSLSTRSLMTVNYSQHKEHRRNYDLHLKKIQEIERTQTKRLNDSQSKIAQHLKRSKQISKKFKDEETSLIRLRQDKKMIKTLIDINKKPRIKTQIYKLPPPTMPARNSSKDKMFNEQRISNQNVRLAKSIMSSASCMKQYKKKMKTEIDQYLKHRTHLQKVRPMDFKAPVLPRRPTKTANELLLLIKQKTEEVQARQSHITISVPAKQKLSDNERQLVL